MFIPYSDVRLVAVEGKRMSDKGHKYTIYRLSIQGVRQQAINLTMHYYRTADLRMVVEEVLAHAEKARMNGLARGLVNGSYSFARH